MARFQSATIATDYVAKLKSPQWRAHTTEETPTDLIAGGVIRLHGPHMCTYPHTGLE